MQETSDCINIDPALPIYNYACGYEILDIFRSCLILPGGPDYRAQTLAGEIRRICAETPGTSDQRRNVINCKQLLTTIYHLIHWIVEDIPHDDEKQDILASTLAILEENPCKWEGLPGLSASVRRWYENDDITECRASGGGNPDEEELAQWRNWAAFLARLAVRDVESLCYGIWIIRKALEGGVRSENQNTPIVKGDSLHTRLCGVRDWLNIAGPRILQLLLVSAGNGTAVDDMAARTCEPGRLCGDAVPAFGARGDVGPQLAELELDEEDTVPLCNEVLAIMGRIEQEAGLV
ncbi:hypothetical protein M0657_002682 [Pyricularia oryzae]|nr:hypothetical protein M9X92_002024 [Pyricularia oryzae]KAI7928574.1 hypothetical protein M0657_002682 [Pyricularia oryzae]